MKEEGYAIYEHFNGQRIRQFPARTARRIDVAVCRIHDLCRSAKFVEREFSIWNALTPVMRMICRKDVDGKVDYISKPYLLPAITYETRLTNGTILKVNNAVGVETDYRMATEYKRNMKFGGRTGDLTNWIKSEKRLDPVPSNFIDKTGYQISEKTLQRTFGKG